MNGRLSIIVSACLMGKNVRYDGGSKLDPFLVDTWGGHLDLMPVCPETGAGLETPREPMRLRVQEGKTRAFGIQSGTDYTVLLETWSEREIHQLTRLDPQGIILKSKSPSCGSDKTDDGHRAAGLFAAVLKEKMPLVPLIDETEFQDHSLRDLFVSRIFTLRRWRETRTGGINRARLVEFHTKNKLLLLSHSPENYRRLGRVAADPGPTSIETRAAHYEKELLELLKHKATEARHVNVLHHIAGYFRKKISENDRAELSQAIESYRQGLSGLAVPITLANHHAKKIKNPYLATQTYLHPHPLEIKLRS